LRLKNLTQLNNGHYCVVISNAFGQVTSESALVRVLARQFLISLTRTQGVVTLRFSTLTNLHYSVDYNDNLEATGWLPLSNAANLPGTGLPITVQDFNTPPTSRFYRVIAE
jgi:hypothetical protein